jgi:hypothetical protein
VVRDRRPVLALLPAFGEVRLGLEVLVEHDQRIHDVGDHVRRRSVCRQTWVERRGLRAPSNRDDLLGGGFFRRACVLADVAVPLVVAAAARDAESEDREQRRDEQQPWVPSHFCPPL